MASSNTVLLKDIWQDVKRFSWTYSLMFLVIISAFGVIYLTHLNRQTTSELEVLYSQQDELDIEWRNLLLEQNSLAEHSEIERKAEQQLLMKRAKPNEEIIIKIP